MMYLIWKHFLFFLSMLFFRWCKAVSWKLCQFELFQTHEHAKRFDFFPICLIFPVIIEIAHTSKNYCELSGRTQPFLGDVVVALTNLGISMKGITTFHKRKTHKIPTPQPISTQKQLNLLQAGTKQSHPSHIPSHLPALPDPHAYVRTPTHKQPVTEYEAIREKAASQKRDVEKALTRFLAKTSDTDCLFASEENQMFPRKYDISQSMWRHQFIDQIVFLINLRRFLLWSMFSDCVQAIVSTVFGRTQSHRPSVRFWRIGIPLFGGESYGRYDCQRWWRRWWGWGWWQQG